MVSANDKLVTCKVVNMVTVDDNQAFEEEYADHPFKYNFIDTPWDDRTKHSKIGIVSLLAAITASIAIGVGNSIFMHYSSGLPSFKVENSCPVMMMNVKENDKNNFVALLYSISSKELLCVGAVLSNNVVLVDEICVRDGPVILVVGSTKDSRCKKGHTVDEIIEIDHGGLLSQKLIILKINGDFGECGSAIPIGCELDWKSPSYIIGRPLYHRGRPHVTKQPVFVFGRGNCSVPKALTPKLDTKKIICVKDFGRCQVHAGDLLTQKGQLFGLASTGVHRSDTTQAYFADLTFVRENLAPFVGKQLRM